MWLPKSKKKKVCFHRTSHSITLEKVMINVPKQSVFKGEELGEGGYAQKKEKGGV